MQRPHECITALIKKTINKVMFAFNQIETTKCTYIHVYIY